MLVLWSTMFFLLTVFASAVAAVAMIGMPVASEVFATVIVMTLGVVAFGLALWVSRPLPTLRDRDSIPPYLFGSNRVRL